MKNKKEKKKVNNKPLWEYVILLFVCVCIVTIFGMSLRAGQTPPPLPKSPLLSPKALQLKGNSLPMTTQVVVVPPVNGTNFTIAFDGDVGSVPGSYYSIDGSQDFINWTSLKMFSQGSGTFYYTNGMTQPFLYFCVRAHSGI